MSGQDKKIGISVDDSGLRIIKESTRNMVAEMKDLAAQQSKNAKDQLKNIEDQIKAHERLVKAQEMSARRDVRYGVQAGDISKKEAREQIREINRDASAEKIVGETLKDLRDEIRREYRAKIDAERAQQQEQKAAQRAKIQEEKNRKKEEAQEERNKEKQLAQDKREEDQNKLKRTIEAQTAVNAVNKAIAAPNPYASASESISGLGGLMLPANPLIGGALLVAGGVGSKGIDFAERYEKSLASLAALRGTNIYKEGRKITTQGEAIDIAELGLNQSQVADKMYAYGEGSGQKITNATAYQLMAMERTRDLNQNTALQLAAIQRYDNKLWTNTKVYDPSAALPTNTERLSGRVFTPGVNLKPGEIPEGGWKVGDNLQTPMGTKTWGKDGTWLDNKQQWQLETGNRDNIGAVS